MRKALLLAVVAAFVLSPLQSFADTPADPAVVEASFDGARLKDELRGILAEPAKETRIRFYASAGSKVSVTMSSLADEGTPIAGMTLRVCDDAGTDLGISGSSFDRSVPESGVISWKRVPIAVTGGYTLILRGTDAGAWHLRLSGHLAAIQQTQKSVALLGVGAETSVDVAGLARSTLSVTLLPNGTSKFRGELVRVERPDGSPLDGVPLANKGTVTLDQDGTHRIVFRNVGNGTGTWTAKAKVTPAPLVTRRGFVRPEGTAFLPRVRRLTPGTGFQRDRSTFVTITGRDFQPGADVRLSRRNFEDILGTDVTVVSETTITCTFDLDTAVLQSKDSAGPWKLGVWNAPVYGVPDDRASLVKESETSDTSRTFTSVTALSIHLPQGVLKGTEVWHLDFNEGFDADLTRMGLGSDDEDVAAGVRSAVEAYVVCFLRDLMQQNETNGKLTTSSVPISFVVGRVPVVAGTAGADYDRIEIGGAAQAEDDRDVAEPLAWGFAPVDLGNQNRDDLSIDVTDSSGTTRVGHGARTRVLDPTDPNADPDWLTATNPLRQTPLTANDKKYLLPGFGPATVGEANRYRDIVLQVTRASREIAAIVAHHIGRAMGLSPGGQGPMANPSTAGVMWPTTTSLAFSAADLATLRTNVVAHQIPGTSKSLGITYFPLLSTQPSFLPNLTTATPYSVDWNFVGGRANATPSDYSIKYTGATGIGSAPGKPLDLTLTFHGLSGTARLYIDSTQGNFYWGLSFFRIAVTDELRGTSTSLLYRLNILPNVSMLRPGTEQQNAINARNTVLNTP